MPDFKFWDPTIAEETCQAPDYAEVTRKAILEMVRQVGDLTMDEFGIAHQGLLVRHLVLPDGQAGTAEIMQFLDQEVSTNTYVNIMAQYRPCGGAPQVKTISRAITRQEFSEAIGMAEKAGIRRLD